jgi:hypothetical protein
MTKAASFLRTVRVHLWWVRQARIFLCAAVLLITAGRLLTHAPLLDLVPY